MSTSNVISFSPRVDAFAKVVLPWISEQYENPKSLPFDRLWFHTAEHTKGVHRRYVQLVNAIRSQYPDLISDDEQEAGEYAALAHDVDQTYMVIDGKHGKKRKRFSGFIEPASAIWAIRLLGSRLTNPQKETLIEGIMGTVPAWDPEKKRLNQPNLKPGCKLTTVLLAMADLGDATMDGTSFGRNGRLMIKEDHLYILEALIDSQGRLPANASFLCERMVEELTNEEELLDSIRDLVDLYLSLVPCEIQPIILGECIGVEKARFYCRAVAAQVQSLYQGKQYDAIFHYVGYGLLKG